MTLNEAIMKPPIVCMGIDTDNKTILEAKQEIIDRIDKEIDKALDNIKDTTNKEEFNKIKSNIYIERFNILMEYMRQLDEIYKTAE